jgi:toxin-antitoxin system PIN domain toxin
MTRRNLLDLNVLIALTDPEHIHRQEAERWFLSTGKDNWGVCPLTEAGFIRIATNPAMQAGTITVERAVAILQGLRAHSGYRYWPIADTENWVAVTARFAVRITGHQLVTDAYLLGLAIKEDGVLVTFDRGIKYMAGAEFRRNVLILE